MYVYDIRSSTYTALPLLPDTSRAVSGLQVASLHLYRGTLGLEGYLAHKKRPSPYSPCRTPGIALL